MVYFYFTQIAKENTMLFSKKIRAMLDKKTIQLKLVNEQTPEEVKNSPPIVEEGITLSKSDILTAVVVLTLVNGVVAMGVAKIAKGGE
jgi:hypothetical protein